MFSVVTGFGEGAGQAIGLHPDVDLVAFTGSTETGKRFLRYSADTNLKRVVLECGGKNPQFVLLDVANLDAVAEQAVAAAFWKIWARIAARDRAFSSAAIARPNCSKKFRPCSKAGRPAICSIPMSSWVR